MKSRLLPGLLLGLLLTACNKPPLEEAQAPAAADRAAAPADSSSARASAEPVGEGVQYGQPFTQVPNPRDAVIYQVNLRAFSAAGTFAGVQARLDSIKALGVNVLYLLPIYPIGVLKGVNSPYCVRDYKAVNSEYGTLGDLRALVAEAHKRNMAVILDWVANHTSWDNPWISNKSWYLQDASGNILSPPNTNWTDVAKLNYHSADLRQAMIEAMKYWVYQANIDGFRCDAADFVPSDFWLQAIDRLRAIPSHKLLMFAEGTRKDLFTAGFQLKYAMGFYYNMVQNIYGKKGSVHSIDALNTVEYFNATCDDRAVRYISNHDVDQDGSPLDQLDGKQGSLAAFVVAAFMKGVPMIYDGQEVGCPLKLAFLGKSTTIDWSLNPEMEKEYERLMAFRNASEAVKQGTLDAMSSDDVCAFTKTFKTAQVLVIANLRNAAESYTTPATLVGSSWKDALTGTELTLSDQVNLQPYQYEILDRQNKELLTRAMDPTALADVGGPAAAAGPKAALFVPGAYEGWNPATAPTIGPAKAAPGVFEGYVNFTGNGPQPFKFTSAPDWTHTNYGDGGSGAFSTDGKAGGLSVPGAGYYELIADLKKNKWTATRTSWSIIGDATPGNWQHDTEMTYDPVKQIWTAEAQLTVGGSFKFRGNDAWQIDFGVDEGGNLQYVDNPYFPYNSALQNLTVPADGSYTVTLDLHIPGQYTYRLKQN